MDGIDVKRLRFFLVLVLVLALVAMARGAWMAVGKRTDASEVSR